MRILNPEDLKFTHEHSEYYTLITFSYQSPINTQIFIYPSFAVALKLPERLLAFVTGINKER